MSEYIDRENLIEDIEQRYCKPCEKEGKDYNHTRCKACWVDDMIGEIVDAPFYDEMAPIVHGKWVKRMFGTHECSNCHNDPCHYDGVTGYSEWLTDFCPYCGADMRGEKG